MHSLATGAQTRTSLADCSMTSLQSLDKSFCIGFALLTLLICLMWAWYKIREESRMSSHFSLHANTQENPKWWTKECISMLMSSLINFVKSILALAAFLIFCVKICLVRQHSPVLVSYVACFAVMGLVIIFISAWSAYCSQLLIYAGIREQVFVTIPKINTCRNLAFKLTVVFAVILIFWLLYDQGVTSWDAFLDWVKLAIPLIFVLRWIRSALGSPRIKWKMVMKLPDSSRRQSLREFLLDRSSQHRSLIEMQDISSQPSVGNARVTMNASNPSTTNVDDPPEAASGFLTRKKSCSSTIIVWMFGEHTALMLAEWRAVLRCSFPKHSKVRAAHVIMLAVIMWVGLMFLGGLGVYFQTLLPRLV